MVAIVRPRSKTTAASSTLFGHDSNWANLISPPTVGPGFVCQQARKVTHPCHHTPYHPCAGLARARALGSPSRFEAQGFSLSVLDCWSAHPKHHDGRSGFYSICLNERATCLDRGSDAAKLFESYRTAPARSNVPPCIGNVE